MSRWLKSSPADWIPPNGTIVSLLWFIALLSVFLDGWDEGGVAYQVGVALGATVIAFCERGRRLLRGEGSALKEEV